MSSFLSSPPPAKMPTPTAPPKSVEVEVENQNVDQTQTPLPPPPGYGVTGILRRWRHEDMLKRGSLGLRVLGFLFSLLAFIIMASNKHGRGRNFDEYEEYRYALAIAILSTLYTGLQSWRQIHEMSTGKEIISGRNSAVIDFFGDQVWLQLYHSDKMVTTVFWTDFYLASIHPSGRNQKDREPRELMVVLVVGGTRERRDFVGQESGNEGEGDDGLAGK
ncbi:Uncharacterized protein family UPF0497, trans-membrane plant [Cynara cardunculus var. scolymus]|uniref:CASP-like protein n=1 Tax=Cynara cardunculus var. scolymus TaxID=59895 RepID=A0A103YLC5_CYNCS|nr:Uncharacterized protein family UPF0497, trans-membrane plant [Cynara cardunculus var. scolymus]